MDFTFDIVNGETPSVTIDGKKISLVSCNYEWLTATGNDIGRSIVTIGGYITGETQFRVFKIDLKTKIAIEL